jgi:prepilin-type processing-associated H-X9-DG protein
MWFPTDDVVCVHPGKSANFVFADGHVYNKKWEEEGTRNNCQKEFGDSGGSPDIPYTKDLYWLQYVAWGDFDLVGFLTSAAEVRKVNYDY